MQVPKTAVSLLVSARQEARRAGALDSTTGESRDAPQSPVSPEERRVLRRWRVTEDIRVGGLNVRAAPSKDAERLLLLQKLMIVEACAPPTGDVTGQWLPIWNPQAPDTRAYVMLEDEENGEVCLEPLDGVTWWRVTDRCKGKGLNLRSRPDKKSPSLGVAPFHMVMKAVAPPIVPAAAGTKYALQLRRWRVALAVSPGKLNCRTGPTKESAVICKLLPQAVVEAVGPPQREEEGEWLQINTAGISGGGKLAPPAIDAQGFPLSLSQPGEVPTTAWVMIKDPYHQVSFEPGLRAFCRVAAGTSQDVTASCPS
jgi:hypothetical protein